MADNTVVQRCCLCDKELNDTNAWTLPERFGKRYSPYCIKCQPKVYDQRAATVGYKLAMFLCAAEFNMPYMPDLFKAAQKLQNDKTNPWAAYTVILCQKGYHKGERFVQFVDGVTDIKKAFDGKSETLYVDDEMLCAEDYVEGRGRQEKEWGKGPKDAPYSSEDYDFMEEKYEAYVESRPYRSSQTDISIKQICSFMLLEQREMNAKNYENAKKIHSMIKDLQDAEQLRKKDELPQDTVRLDDIALAVERAGLHTMDYEELKKELATYMFHTPYGYTRDAADQMLLLIKNATAWNEGTAEVASLPPSLRMQDPYGEFAEKPDDIERQIYEELDLVRADE